MCVCVCVCILIGGRWPCSAVFPTENTHAHCGYPSSRQGVKLPYAIAVSSPCVLALQMSLQGWRGLARVVCLPGYPLPRDIYLLDRCPA